MPPPVRIWRWAALTAAVIVIAVVVARPGPMIAEDLHVELTDTAVIARDSGGVEQWRHQFPGTHKTVVPMDPVVMGGVSPGVYVATSYRGRQNEQGVEGGVLTLMDLEGRQQRAFSFHDKVMVDGAAYGPPWAITGFAVRDAMDTVRVAVTAHHYVWDPGILTILDDEWRRRGTFVNEGWLEHVRWLTNERLLVSGFSNGQDGGMVALLDAAALDEGPLRMLVFPRTEVNRVSASRFNRAGTQTFADGRLSIHTAEMASPTGDAGAVYDITPSLDIVAAKFNERYWDMHRSLEDQGKIDHTREACPDREGPRAVDIWEPGTGWTTTKIR